MKILLLECNDTYFRDVALALIKQKLPVSHIITSFPALYEKDTAFKKVEILDERNYNFSDLITSLNVGSTESLSATTIQKFRELESLYLSISDRLSFYPKSVAVRKQRYYELLLYWLTFLKKNNITVVVFPRVPHLGYGNIIYALTKELNIKTLIIRDTLVDNKVLITPGFNAFKKIPTQFLKNTSLHQLETALDPDWRGLLSVRSNLMKINLQENSAAMKQNERSILANLTDLSTLKAVFSLLHNPFERVYLSPMYMEPPATWLDYYLMISKYYLKNRKLYSYYQSVSKNVNIKKPFIYVALHYQPERTSMPEGGVFENQLLMIDILSKSLPKDWYLYIKEHPNQFSRMDIRKMNFRDIMYYQKLLQYPNVKLVSLQTDSHTLISKCKAAVTLTGSTGWEALLKGKPALTFSASAWYSACASAITVTSLEECKDAIKAIRTSSKDKVRKDLLKFLLYYKDKFVTASPSVELADSNSSTYQVLIHNLVTAIKKRL